MRPTQALVALVLFLVLTVVPSTTSAADPVVTLSPASYEEALGPVLRDRHLQRSTYGVQVVDVASGTEVFARFADRGLVPASTAKVLTAAAALKALGPSFNFTTDVHTAGERRGDVLTGDLYLVGHADPTLTVERLWRLLSDIRLDGYGHIEGDLVLDGSYFEEAPRIPGWDKPEDLERGPSYFPAIGAFGMDFGAATVVVRPAGEAGRPATVELAVPSEGYLSIEGEVSTTGPGTRSRIELSRELRGDRMVMVVGGSIPLDSDARRYRRAIHDPTAYAVGVVRGLLDDVGLEVTGSVRAGTMPEDVPRIRRLYSPPLASILMDTNKYSSNFMAEMVLRTLGAERHEEGSTAAGLRVIRDYLDDLGIPRDDYAIVNGSGLSRDTRLPASALNAALIDMAHDPRVGHEFVGSLAIAGEDGTLVRRLTEVTRRVRGKTGTLAQVHGLTGYVEGRDGRLYAFSFLINDVEGGLWRVKDVQDAFLLRLAGLPEGP